MTSAHATASHPDADLCRSLQIAGLIGDPAECRFEALAGGVSSDIWKVSTPSSVYCVKRALAKLKVAADWQAPVERNRYEVAWNRFVQEIVPGAVPELLHHDPDAMLFAMAYLDPADHRLWKSELRDGRADPADAARVGECLGRVHAATAGNPDVITAFPPNGIFHAIRLEPYLEATATAHPDLADRLYALSRRTGAIRATLVHGDVSPKNILIGPGGPVFLDAECACVGDPAFDLAFCLNHFLLKCLWNPVAHPAYLSCFSAMTDAYLRHVNWEPADLVEARAASLLPGLLLARVDGKSPVEYLQDPSQKAHVRRCARALIASPPDHLGDVLAAWTRELNS